MIHFVTGDSATAALEHAFRADGNEHQIYGLPLDFSVGPISGIDEENGIQQHFDWLNSSFNIRNDHSTYQEETYRQSLEKLKSLKEGEQVTIWTCENASEQIGLRLFCLLVTDKKVALSLINTAGAMRDFYMDTDIEIEIRHTGECSSEQLVSFYNRYRTEIKQKSAETFSKEAKRLLCSSSYLRTWRQGEIIDDNETRDDQFILNCVDELQEYDVNQGFVKASRVIGQVFGETRSIYSDYWIDYRLRSLISAGHLLSTGDLRSIRSYEVRGRTEEIWQ